MISVTVNPQLIAEYRGSGFWGDASLHDYWRLAVLSAPEREAVVDARGTRWTYAQVEDLAARIAGHLRDAGVERGDVVSVQLPNWAEFLAVNVACLKLGAVVNPMLPAHRRTELSYRLDACGSTALVMATQFRSMDYRELVAHLVDATPGVRTVLLVENGGVPAGRFTSFGEAARHDPLPEPAGEPGRGTDVATVLFTSGSEAKPKGVLLSHDNVLAAERGFAYDLNLGGVDRLFMPAPIGHATGYLHGMTMPYVIGGTAVLLDQFSGPAAQAMIEAERCTWAMGTTSVVSDLCDACEQAGATLHGVRSLCCGGAPVPRRLFERVRRLGTRLHSVYGSTESAPHMLVRHDDPDEVAINTDGRAVTGTQVKVVDPKTRRTLPPGMEGEEASRGPGVFLGYLGDPEVTARAMDTDGWYYSGDLAVLDSAGYLRVTGRIKDVIVRGGENISATEIEGIIREHADVRDVAVVGMPNERLGECACACIVLAPGRSPVDLVGLRDFFVERGVAKYKIPERIEIMANLPMTQSGKVSKGDLRIRIAELLAAERATGGYPAQSRG